MHVKPHVERFARLLHNRVVRRVLHAHPTAATLVLVGDLVDGVVMLQPTSVWDAEGRLLADGTPDLPMQLARWRSLGDDLRPDFGLMARVNPVQLFVPYVLDLRQLDLRLESDEPIEDVELPVRLDRPAHDEAALDQPALDPSGRDAAD